MSLFVEDLLAKKWLGKIQKARKRYDDWSNKFQCDRLEEYFYGFQWDGNPDGRYVMNFVFSTIEIKKPSMFFDEPLFHVKPKPSSADWDFESSKERAQLREDVINTIISDQDQDFVDEFELFVVDAFFRFGVMEIGYSANWLENPNAGRPILKSDNDPFKDPDDKDNILKEPEKVPEEERIYFKRIPPWRFRVGGDDGHNFKKVEWIGYWEYVRTVDLKNHPGIENKEVLEGLGGDGNGPDNQSGQVGTSMWEPNESQMEGMVKIWTIFDLRAKKKYLFLQSPELTLLEREWDYLPLVTMKFVEKLRGWYPVPPVFQWKSPQDEINESRQQQRIHRRRAARKYLVKEGTFNDDNEMDKLENGEDMTFARVLLDPGSCIKPLEQPALDNVLNQTLVVSRDDLNIISGTSSEQRGVSDRQTATQSTIMDQRTQMRESRSRMQVAKALKNIGRLVLCTVRDNFSNKFWVKVRTSRFNDDFLGEFQEAQEQWQQFKANDLGKDDDFEVNISLDAISPIENQQSKQSFVEFLSLMTNFPAVAMDPTLVRETAYRCGYRNEKVISRAAQMAQLAMIGRIEAAKQSVMQQAMMSGMADQAVNGQNGSGNLAQTRVAQMQAPDQNQINTQLQGQLPVG